MGSVFRKVSTRPIPKAAEIVEKGGQRFARWRVRGKLRTAPLSEAGTTVRQESGTYYAKYRDGAGKEVIRATGCRQEQTARQRLTEWEREAEQIRAGVLTGKELAQAKKSRDPIEEHFTAFEGRQSAKQVSPVYLKNTMSALRRIAEDCDFPTLADLDAEPVERWLTARRTEGMAAKTRNGYREAWNLFLNWCVETGRLAANPFHRLPLANVKTDRRKTRRAMTEAELGKLLAVARDRALNARLRERLDGKPAKLSPAYRAKLERNGRIRALIYKTYILTGLRFDELRSLTVGDVRFDGTPRIELAAANEKSRKGSRIPLRPDLAGDLRAYLDERARETQAAIPARE